MDDLLEKVQGVLSTTPERWKKLVNVLPVDLLTRPPTIGEWSALDCLQHLLDTEHLVFPVRIHAFLAGQDLIPFDPDKQQVNNASQTPEQLVVAFARSRQESLAMLKRLTVQDLVRSAHHSELGLVTLRELLNEWAAHDLMHTVQAERALMQPFILDCGPWRDYFRDHDTGA